MTTLREAAQQALEALMDDCLVKVGPHSWERRSDLAIAALRAALAEPVQSGSCIACGNRMTGSPKSFVVATAEVGVTAPEGYSPQQVEALHPHKVGDKTAPPLAASVQNSQDFGVAGSATSPWRESAAKGCSPSGIGMPATPPQRKPLTDEKVCDLWSWSMTTEAERTATTQQHAFARAIELAHGIGGQP